MNMKSKDGKCTILEWNKNQFRWLEHGYNCILSRGSYSVYSSIPSLQDRLTPIPPEAVEWINGQNTPPFKVGDKVRWEGGISTIEDDWTIGYIFEEEEITNLATHILVAVRNGKPHMARVNPSSLTRA